MGFIGVPLFKEQVMRNNENKKDVTKGMTSITCTASPAVHHLRCITCGASPAVHHLRCITCSASPAVHHLQCITCCASPSVIYHHPPSSYLTSLSLIIFKNMAHVGSFCHFVFVFA